MLFVRIVHFDLVISEIDVHECEELMLPSRIHKLIDARWWVTIFRADFVDVRENNACSASPAWFAN